MKRIVWLLMAVLCFSGCSSENRALEEGLEFRDRLLEAQGCQFTAEITADYGQTLYSFGMECQADEIGAMTFQVTSPESISGITGTISDTGGALTFADTALQFDLMADDQLTPVSSPWILLRTMRSGYITSACWEEELLRLSIDDSYEEDALHLDIWLEEGIPVRGDILYDGKRILALDVKSFVFL